MLIATIREITPKLKSGGRLQRQVLTQICQLCHKSHNLFKVTVGLIVKCVKTPFEIDNHLMMRVP